MKPLRVDEAFDGYHEDDRDPNAGWWSRPAVAHPFCANIHNRTADKLDHEIN